MSNSDLYPGAEYRPLASGLPSSMTVQDIVCFHTMGGFLWGTDSMFRKGGWSGTESHFGIGGPYDRPGDDGKVVQWVPCDRRADANLEGNWHVISIETSDGNRTPVPPWSAAQIESIAKVTAWACKRYNIPPERIPDSKTTRRGIGYHRHGIDPWRVAGGEKWSSSQGKVCPGEARMAQVDQIIARVKILLGVSTKPPVKPPSSAAEYTLAFDGGATMTLRYLKRVAPMMKGGDVKSLQGTLNLKGYNAGTPDGVFGDGTKAAVQRAQTSLGLAADGVVGPATMEKLWER